MNASTYLCSTIGIKRNKHPLLFGWSPKDNPSNNPWAEIATISKYGVKLAIGLTWVSWYGFKLLVFELFYLKINKDQQYKIEIYE